MAPRPAGFLAIGVAFVVLLAVLVAASATDGFDAAVIGFVRATELHGVLGFLGPITELGSTAAVTLVALITLFAGAAVGPWRHGAYGALAIGAASLGMTLLKTFMARERPDLLEPVIDEHGFSFPSGHSLLSMVAYGILAVLVSRSRLPTPVRRAVAVGAAALVFLIGLSRVWLGVHYPTDVLAGWVAGAVIVVLFATLTRGVSREPAVGAVDVDPAARRSDPPAAG